MVTSTQIGFAPIQGMFLGPLCPVPDTVEDQILPIHFPEGKKFRFSALESEVDNSGCLCPLERLLRGTMIFKQPAYVEPNRIGTKRTKKKQALHPAGGTQASRWQCSP